MSSSIKSQNGTSTEFGSVDGGESKVKDRKREKLFDRLIIVRDVPFIVWHIFSLEYIII
jgi:hypothetical protein